MRHARYGPEHHADHQQQQDGSAEARASPDPQWVDLSHSLLSNEQSHSHARFLLLRRRGHLSLLLGRYVSRSLLLVLTTS